MTTASFPPTRTSSPPRCSTRRAATRPYSSVSRRQRATGSGSRPTSRCRRRPTCSRSWRGSSGSVRDETRLCLLRLGSGVLLGFALGPARRGTAVFAFDAPDLPRALAVDPSAPRPGHGGFLLHVHLVEAPCPIWLRPYRAQRNGALRRDTPGRPTTHGRQTVCPTANPSRDWVRVMSTDSTWSSRRGSRS